MTDPILFWNNVSLEANRIDHTGALRARNQRGPTLSSRALSMVHIAMHDAYFGFVLSGTAHNPDSYPVVLPQNRLTAESVPTKDEIAIAVSYAAHGVLSDLYPSQVDVFDRHLEAVMSGAEREKNDPETVGRTVARQVLAERENDGAERNEMPLFDQHKGHHRPDPFNESQGLLGKAYGKTRHFALKGGHLRLDPPPGYIDARSFNENDPVYLEHFREVREFGIRAGSKRTNDDTLTGIYWAYDGAEEIGTPPRLYNQIAVKILTDRNRSYSEVQRQIITARTLMLVNVAMADAAIEAWHHKFAYDIWRPVLGVRERGIGLGPKTIAKERVDADADPFWEPLGAPASNTNGRDFTPPFPAYPSGHATFGGAVFETLRLAFGVAPSAADNIGFELVSDELNGRSKDSKGVVRPRREIKYNRLIDAMYDNGTSRVFLGVHWRFDAMMAKSADQLLSNNDFIGGISLGRAVATHVFESLGGIAAG